METSGQVSVTKHCANCKKDVAEANFVMHEVHCRRNIVLCSKCDAPVPKVQLQEHIEENHALVNCDLCSQLVERSCLSGHKTELCSKRGKVCSYCSLSVKADELVDHESYCGTRTEQCVKCHSYIMHKDLIIHDESDCNLPEQTESASKADFFDHYQPESLNDFSSHLSELQVENDDEDVYRNLNQKYMNSYAHPYFDLDGYQKTNLNSNGDSSLDRRSVGFERLTADRWYNEQSENKKYFGEYPKYNAQRKSNGINEANEMRDSCLDSEEDIAFLPCEFCDESFPVDVIIQHQAMCSNNLENPECNLVRDYGANFFEKKDKIDPVKSSLAESLAREPTMLPCEFCSEPYANDELMSHQVSCEVGHFLNNDGYAVENVERPPSLPSGLNKTVANKSSIGSTLRSSTSIPTDLSHLENSSSTAAAKQRMGANVNRPRNLVGNRKPTGISKQLPLGAKTANRSNAKLTSHQLKESDDALQFRGMQMNDISKSPDEVAATNLSRAGFTPSKQNSAMNHQQSSRQIGKDSFQVKSTRVAAGNQTENQRKKEQEMGTRRTRTMTTASNNQRKDSKSSQDQHGSH